MLNKIFFLPMSSKFGYTIKDIENLTGIKAHTIRIWEKRYNIVEPNRSDTNIRYYTDNDLRKLLAISMLNRKGFKISSLVELSEKELKEKVKLISQSTSDYQTQIDGLILAMNELDELRFEKLLNQYIMHQGIEVSIEQIVFPFLKRIGILWQIGAIIPSQEHFISGIIRRKLIVAIDNEIIEERTVEKSILLLSPENEHHEIPLLYYTYLLRKYGFNVMYLGTQTPIHEIPKILNIKQAKNVLISFVLRIPDEDYLDTLQLINKTLPKTKVFIIDNQDNVNDTIIPENIVRLKNKVDFFEKILKIKREHN